jgi:hypothetical protein
MSLIPFILLVVGLLLVFLELFFPSGIMAAIATLLLVASIAFFAWESSSLMGTLLYLVGIGIVIALLIKITLSQIRKGK